MLKVKSIRSKILIGFLVVILIPFLAMGFIFFDTYYREISKEATDKLILFGEVKEKQILNYLDSLKSQTLEFSNDIIIRDNLSLINLDNDLEAKETINRYLIYNKQIIDESIMEIAILDSEANVVAGTNNEQVGNNYVKDKVFNNAKDGVFIESINNYERFGTENVFSVSNLLTDKVTGNFIGVIVVYFSTYDLNKNLTNFTENEGDALYNKGYSDTFKVYLVHSEDDMFIYQGNNFSTEKSLSAKKTIIDTLPIKRCLLYKEDIVDKYINYSGNNVIGVSKCFSEQGWILVSEVSEKDMLSAFMIILKRLIIIFVSIILLTILVSFYISLIITRPINNLTNSAKQILAGNLRSRAKVDSSDEIGELAMYYNVMTSKLEKSMEDIEKKVEARTSHLYKLNRAMVGRELKMIELKKKNRELRRIIKKQEEK